MAITRKKKEELVSVYREQIANSTVLVFTNYRGVSVPQIQSLRTKLQENDSKYMVVKNSLLRIALEEAGRPTPDELLNGPNAVAFIGEDIGRTVKSLQDWIKEAKIVEIQGSIMETSVLNADRTEALSDLPTKEQTLAMILGAIAAPSSSLVRMLNAPMSSLARVINAHVEKQQEEAA